MLLNRHNTNWIFFGDVGQRDRYLLMDLVHIAPVGKDVLVGINFVPRYFLSANKFDGLKCSFKKNMSLISATAL